MTEEKMMQDINEIFRDVLDNNDLVIKRETTANDVEEWDSLTHIQLLVALEKRFKIRFSSSEMQKFQNVGEMADAILQKTSEQ
ncbi:acyl carrier protein [soil metagenome]